MALQKPARVEDPELLHLISRLPCVACAKPGRLEDLDWVLHNLDRAPRISDPHHLTSKGAGGDDKADNVMPLCRDHHNEVEAPNRGLTWMLTRYPAMRDWLVTAGRKDLIRAHAQRLADHIEDRLGAKG